MHPEDALAQIARIRGQLARAELFRGTRAATVAATALVAQVAVLLQPRVVPQPDAQAVAYVLFWSAAAGVALALVLAQIGFTYAACGSSQERATARVTLGQVFPPLAAGALVTIPLTLAGRHDLLPGLWPVFVGLSLFAARPMLPRATGWVALAYGLAGGAILFLLPDGRALAPWVMGLTFTLGQLGVAAVFYWNLERAGEEAP